ncbi:MAG: hypothetical protein JST08_00485 [Actinobacteria bacterium]|nr:hypothetical protein [Actinomycetota bacterium]
MAKAGRVPGKVKKNIRLARRTLNKYGGKNKPIWITEIGWPVENGAITPEPQPETHPRVSEVEQAKLLASVIPMIKGSASEFNIKNLFWYNVEDFGGSKWDGYCGLFTSSGQKRGSLAKFREQVE